MNKYFIKISAISLMIIVFPLASNICFSELSNPFIEIKSAEAAVSDQGVIDLRVCGEETAPRGEEPSMELTYPVPMSSHSNDILPCCVSSNHPTAIAVNHAPEIEKFVPAIFLDQISEPRIIPITIAYHSPNISPPKLLAVKTTNLRI
jgi:hypothetical protein